MGPSFAIALRTYLAPIAYTRAFRIGLVVAFCLSGLIALLLALQLVSPDISKAILREIRRSILIPGIPLAALLLSEMPLRDGIRHRTLLYPLLGPVPRPVLALTRTAATGVLLAIPAWVFLAVLRLLEGETLAPLGQEALGALLGSLTYISLFGVVQLITRHGLITSLAVYMLFDDPLSRLPFALSKLSPAFHLRVLADRQMEFEIPGIASSPEGTVWLSALLLLGLAAVFHALAAALFSRKNLGGIC